MQIDLTQIILAVITLLGAVLSTFVIPLLKSKLTLQQQEAVDKAIKIAVYAAEQTKSNESGDARKAWVLKFLKEQGINVDLDAVDAQIEAVVKTLKIEQGKQANQQ